MRIGIITILKANNYGAELQAYSLQKKLELLGFDSEIIDYLYYKHPDYIFTKQARPLLNIGLMNTLKEKAHPWVEKLARLTRRQSSLRSQRFDLFHLQRTRMSGKTYRSMDELYAAELPYDVFMVGSDQVWSPRTDVSLKPYFLTFAQNGKKTISYASSFGVAAIPREAERVYADCLKHIQYLSVREEQGVDIIRKLTGRTAEHVLDPTLLLTKEEWCRIAVEPPIDKPYVLLYDLIHSPYAVALALHIARLCGLSVVRICGSAKINRAGVVNIIDAGPAEFLGLFANAAYVVTNSFHGTAFSVNFHKPFFTVVPKGKANTSRLHSFIKTLALDRRLMSEGSAFPPLDTLALDFSEADTHLENARARSLDFLLKSLKA